MKGEEETREGMDVLWIGCRDKPENLEKYVAEHEIGDWIFDEGDKIIEHFQIKSGAGLVLITKDGRVRAKVDGYFSKRMLDKLMNNAFASVGATNS